MANLAILAGVAGLVGFVISYYTHNSFREFVVRYPVFAILSESYIIMMILLVLWAQISPRWA